MYQVTAFRSGATQGDPGARREILLTTEGKTIYTALTKAARKLLTSLVGPLLGQVGVDVHQDGDLVFTAYADTISQAIIEARNMNRNMMRRTSNRR